MHPLAPCVGHVRSCRHPSVTITLGFRDTVACFRACLWDETKQEMLFHRESRRSLARSQAERNEGKATRVDTREAAGRRAAQSQIADHVRNARSDLGRLSRVESPVRQQETGVERRHVPAANSPPPNSGLLSVRLDDLGFEPALAEQRIGD